MPGRSEFRSGCLRVLLFSGAAIAVSRVPGGLGPVLAATVAAVGLLSAWGSTARLRRLRALRLSDVDHMNGAEFEAYVALLMERRGCRVERTGGAGDLGVDLIAHSGVSRSAVQVKRSDRPISRRAVSDAVAAQAHYGCAAAMVVTNSTFTRGAQELAQSTGCRLVDREELAAWIEAFRRRSRSQRPGSAPEA